MAFKLGFLTVGILREPVGHPQVQGFIDRLPGLYRLAENSDGYRDRSIRDVGKWLHSWGPVELPKCFPPPADETRIAMTLSLWNDLESVAAFAYHGAHAEALGKRWEWFEKHKLPTYVAWWVPEDHQIDWHEGSTKLEHLHVHGSTAVAFDFERPFLPDGTAYSLDRMSVRAKVVINAQVQAS
jgi:hypothetical protein